MVLLASLAATPVLVQTQTQQDRTQDKVAFPAHTIIGNLHYVGTATLNSFLFTTPQGHILINTNYEDTVPLLRASVEKLGFKLTDIKIVLGSHAHPDHQQADAMLKELSGGAMVMAMEQDVPALKAMKAPSGKAYSADRVLKDGEQVSLGGTTLTAHLTPGHTRGCTTWTTRIADGGRTYNVVIACAGLQANAQLVNNRTIPKSPRISPGASRRGSHCRQTSFSERTAGSSIWLASTRGSGAPPTRMSIPRATKRGSTTWRRTTTPRSRSRRRAH